jgi:hypothetical protein
MPRKLSLFLEEKFKECRQENYKCTITSFGKTLGIGRENLNGYMNPKTSREPRISQCVLMAKGLRMPLIDFLVASGLVPESAASRATGLSIPLDKLPVAVRSAMATEEWAELCPAPDEIERVSAMEPKDAESVLQAIRDLPWRKVKRLFMESAVPNDIQESCYRLCRAVVFDSEGRFTEE